VNKKGLIYDFGGLVIVVLILVILGAFLLLIISANANNKKQQFEQKVSMLDSSYQTRIILQQEIAPGYKVFEFIIDKVNQKDYDAIDDKMPDIINAHMLDSDIGEWFYVVNDHIGKYNAFALPYGAMKILPKTIIPNPEGEDIEVIIKQISPADFKIEEKYPIMYHTKQYIG